MRALLVALKFEWPIFITDYVKLVRIKDKLQLSVAISTELLRIVASVLWQLKFLALSLYEVVKDKGINFLHLKDVHMNVNERKRRERERERASRKLNDGNNNNNYNWDNCTQWIMSTTCMPAISAYWKTLCVDFKYKPDLK